MSSPEQSRIPIQTSFSLGCSASISGPDRMSCTDSQGVTPRQAGWTRCMAGRSVLENNAGWP
jgi:hypothetical protein